MAVSSGSRAQPSALDITSDTPSVYISTRSPASIDTVSTSHRDPDNTAEISGPVLPSHTGSRASPHRTLGGWPALTYRSRPSPGATSAANSGTNRSGPNAAKP